MVSHDESKIVKLVCIDKTGSLRYPCGACREHLMQLHKDNKDMQILTNLKTGEYTTLKQLLPNWWGESRF